MSKNDETDTSLIPSQEDDNDSDGQMTNDAGQPITLSSDSVFWSRWVVVIVAFMNLGYLVYYLGVVWAQTKFQYEYTSWINPGQIPGPLVIQVNQNSQYFALTWMIFAIFPPLVSLWMVIKPTAWVRYDLHRITIAAVAIIILCLAIYFILFVWVWQNGSSFYPFSIANSVLYCCKWYGVVTSSHKCNNQYECVDVPTTPTIYLPTDPVFEEHLYSFGFILLGQLLMLFTNAMLRNYTSSAIYNQLNANRIIPGYSPDSRFYEKITGPNRYTSGSVVAINVFNAIYLLLVCLVLTLGVLKLDIRDTHEFPPTGPFDTRSARGTVESVGLYMMGGAAILMPGLVLTAMICVGNFWGLLVVFISMLLVTGVHMFSLMTMVYSRGTGNRPGFPNSLANHPLRCCAPDTYGDSASQCGNTFLGLVQGACTLPANGFPNITSIANSNQVPYNPIHNLIFGMTIALLILDVLLVFLVFLAYLGRSIEKKAPEKIASKIGTLMDWTEAIVGSSIEKKDPMMPVIKPPLVVGSMVQSTLPANTRVNLMSMPKSTVFNRHGLGNTIPSNE